MICARVDCFNSFESNHPRKKYCSNTCKNTEGVRAFRRINPRSIYAEKEKEYNLAHRMANREANNKNALAYYYAHQNERIAYSKTYKEKVGKEAINAARRKYVSTRPYAIQRVRASRKVALEYRTPGYLTLTEDEWNLLLDAWEYKCAYCATALGDKPTQDHVIPLIKNGTHTLDNILPACLTCNTSKGSRDLGDFLIGLYQKLGGDPWKMPK